MDAHPLLRLLRHDSRPLRRPELIYISCSRCPSSRSGDSAGSAPRDFVKRRYRDATGSESLISDHTHTHTHTYRSIGGSEFHSWTRD
jgi:hypothetical protein